MIIIAYDICNYLLGCALASYPNSCSSYNYNYSLYMCLSSGHWNVSEPVCDKPSVSEHMTGSNGL